MSKRHTFEYVKQYFQNNNCELLENIYKNNSTKMRYLCNCGNMSEISFSSFKKGSRCKKCGSRKGAEKQNLEYSEVESIFKNEGCELLEKKYKNHGQKLKYKCNCGNISTITFNSFKRGRRCSKCGGTKKLLFEYVKQYFKDQGCELLESEYINSRTLMKYKCECGNISEICFDGFKRGRRCKKCGYEKTTGENHWNYNSNLTDEDRQDRRLVDGYLQWIKNIYKKNNYTCQKCIQRGGKLNAHHIKNYSSNKELRVDENNGICLCCACHTKFHKIYGKKNNNKQQLEEFINI